MTTKRHYEKPAMQEFELKQQPTLLAGSTTIDDYLDGGNPWEQL